MAVPPRSAPFSAVRSKLVAWKVSNYDHKPAQHIACCDSQHHGANCNAHRIALFGRDSA